MHKSAPKKVLVAMSGGVDSSVAAALLKKKGFFVVGVFIIAWHPENLLCTWPDERRDAMRVAAQLDIPLLTFNFEKEYKREVIDVMIADYKRGLTPNPDVLCNSAVKFGLFYRKAREMGADYIATGHYARVKHKEDGSHLMRGVDKAKDQTYFLWKIEQEVLRHTLFPVGEMQKHEVRHEARLRGLHTATKRDSQGLCFVGKLDFQDFLESYIPLASGAVLNENSEVVGEHKGTAFYTLGQRHGFSVDDATPREPLYVIDKDHKQNTITVSTAPKKGETDEAYARDPHWIHGTRPLEAIEARVVYGGPLHRAQVAQSDDTLKVSFDEKVRITPGQSIVFYRNHECLGGALLT